MKQIKVFKKRTLSVLLVVVMVLGMFGLTGCGGGSTEHVKFWIYGNETEKEIYTAPQVEVIEIEVEKGFAQSNVYESQPLNW